VQRTEAQKQLETIARRLRPAQPPWNADAAVLDDWVKVVLHRNAEAAHVTAVFEHWHDSGNTRWMNLYTFRQMLDRTCAARPRDHGHNYKDCQDCAGTGWSTVMDGEDAATFNRNGTNYTWCQPCRCSAGNYAEQSTIWKETLHPKQPDQVDA
jgi:hypothetical protein